MVWWWDTYGLARLLEGILGSHSLGHIAAEEGLDNAVDGAEEDTTLTCNEHYGLR